MKKSEKKKDDAGILELTRTKTNMIKMTAFKSGFEIFALILYHKKA